MKCPADDQREEAVLVSVEKLNFVVEIDTLHSWQLLVAYPNDLIQIQTHHPESSRAILGDLKKRIHQIQSMAYVRIFII